VRVVVASCRRDGEACGPGRGMHRHGCERALSAALTCLDDILDARAEGRAGRVTAHYDPWQLDERRLPSRPNSPATGRGSATSNLTFHLDGSCSVILEGEKQREGT